MKLIPAICLLGILFTSCNEEPSSTDSISKNQNKNDDSSIVKPVDNIVSRFLNDVKSFSNDTNANPIASFVEIAENMADKKIVINEDNIVEVLNISKDYSSCVVVTENHTIVKIIDYNDTQKSGSWKAHMPKASGYIKRSGSLSYENDYMNYIIGVPDDQKRVAYFFNFPNSEQKETEKSPSEIIISDTTYIKVLSTNKPSEGWEKCNDLYCNTFYFTDFSLDYHPVFTDKKNNYLFFMEKWKQWVFYSHFPDKETKDALLNQKVVIPYLDRLCYVNSFNPCSYTDWVNDHKVYCDSQYFEQHYKLGAEYSDISKELIWVGNYNQKQYEKKMLKNKAILEKTKKQESFNKLLSNYNSSTNPNKLIPDTSINENGFESKIVTYLKKHYNLNEDSSYNSIDNSELDENMYYADVETILYYSTHSDKLEKQITIVEHNREGEMDFNNEFKVTFPNLTKSDINSLFDLLEIKMVEDDPDENGSCGFNDFKEVYSVESTDILIEFNVESNETVVKYIYSGGGC